MEPERPVPLRANALSVVVLTLQRPWGLNRRSFMVEPLDDEARGPRIPPLRSRDGTRPSTTRLRNKRAGCGWHRWGTYGPLCGGRSVGRQEVDWGWTQPPAQPGTRAAQGTAIAADLATEEGILLRGRIPIGGAT